MSSTRLLAAATTAVLLAIPAARAADLGIPPPPPPPEFSGWYLRGYVGMTNQQVDKIGFKPNPFPADNITTPFADFDASPLFGLGVGYQFNDWLRFDGTVEYRSSAHFHGQQVDHSVAPVQFADDYNASKSEILFLANAYVDELHNSNSSLALTSAGARRLFFENQLAQQKDALAEAEIALKKQQQASGLVLPQGQAEALVHSIATLRAEITAREVQLQAMQAYAAAPELFRKLVLTEFATVTARLLL